MSTNKLSLCFFPPLLCSAFNRNHQQLDLHQHHHQFVLVMLLLNCYSSFHLVTTCYLFPVTSPKHSVYTLYDYPRGNPLILQQNGS